MIKEMLAEGWTQKALADWLVANRFAPNLGEAWLMIRIELGEVRSDVVYLDEEGNEIAPPPGRNG